MGLGSKLRIGIKWVCTTCGVLLAAAWFVSGCCYLTWSDGLERSVEVHRGRVVTWDASMVEVNNPAHLKVRRMTGRPIWDWYYNGAESPWDWAFHWRGNSNGDGRLTVLPLWMPVVMMSVPAIVLWVPDVRVVWRRRRADVLNSGA